MADARRAIEIAERLDRQSSGAAGYQALLASAYALAGRVELKQGHAEPARAALNKAQQRIEKARAANPDSPLLIERAGEVEALLRQIGK
jgi:hypothetical protein